VDSGAVALVAQHILFLGEKNDGSGSQWRSGSFDGSVEVLGSGTAAIVVAVQPPASGTGHAEAAEAQQPVVAEKSQIAAAVSRQAAAGESTAAGVVAAVAVEIGASSAADISSTVEGGGNAEGQQQRQPSRQLLQCGDGSTRGRQQWQHSRSGTAAVEMAVQVFTAEVTAVSVQASCSSTEGQQQRQHSRQLLQCGDGSRTTRGRQQWQHSRSGTAAVEMAVQEFTAEVTDYVLG
jgi:hypothetical protein